MNTFEKFETHKKVCEVLKWRIDVESGEMIQDRLHTKTHMGFSFCAHVEYDVICDTVNKYFEMVDSKMRVGYSMGEFVPCFSRQRELKV